MSRICGATDARRRARPAARRSSARRGGSARLCERGRGQRTARSAGASDASFIIRKPPIAATATRRGDAEAEQRPRAQRSASAARAFGVARQRSARRARRRRAGADTDGMRARAARRAARRRSACSASRERARPGRARSAATSNALSSVRKLVVDEGGDLIVDLFCHWAAALSVLVVCVTSNGASVLVDRFASAKDARTHGADRALHGLRDFLVAQPFDFAQQNGGSQLFRQVLGWRG